MEGKEVRFGIANSALLATVTTDASCGAVNGMHDLHAARRSGSLVNIMLGEVVFGGVGAGMYGVLIFVVLAVFIAGLMVGRTPEYLGKKIEAYDVKMAMLYVLIFPLSSGVCRRISVLSAKFGLATLTNAAPRAYQKFFTPSPPPTGNNGSAFAGLGGNRSVQPDHGATMLIGRFLMIVPMLAIAGNLARKKSFRPRRHLPGDNAVLQRVAGKRDPDCRRADVFPGSEPGTDSGALADASGKDILPRTLESHDMPKQSKSKSLWDAGIVRQALSIRSSN